MTRVYDLVMTHKLDADDLFIHRIQGHCARLRLNFFLVEPLWVESFSQAFAAGSVWARVLLNMHSEHHRPEDPFTRLIRMAALKGTRVIDPPDVALAAFDKAAFHAKAQSAGLKVPYTLMVPQSLAETFRMTDEERAALGTPFVIKPAMGYGRRGVILDATSEEDLKRSSAQWPGGDSLLQRRLTPRKIGEWPAYFRVYHAFGSIWCNWWNCYSDQSRPVTPGEREQHQLAPLEDIARSLAACSGMTFFSTEILQTEEGEFVVIDYVNDQCHMLSQSSDPRIGVPDIVVEAIAERLVEGAAGWIRGQ